jgi:SAM-dependent methyltransferase
MFAGRFLEALNPRIPGRPHAQIVALAGLDTTRALDICAGTAYAGRSLARRSATEVVAIDLSPELLRVGRRLAVAEGLSAQVRFVQGDAARLPFQTDEFDVVLAAFGLHELSPATRARAIAEVERVLRPHRWFLIVDIDNPQRRRRLFSAYLRLSHGRRAYGVLGNGLVDLLGSMGFKIRVHRRFMGGFLPFQVIAATAPSSAKAERSASASDALRAAARDL